MCVRARGLMPGCQQRYSRETGHQSVSFTQSLKQLIMSIIVFEFSQLFFHNSLISRCGARRTRDGRVAIGGSGGVGGAGGGGGVGLGGVSV